MPRAPSIGRAAFRHSGKRGRRTEYDRLRPFGAINRLEQPKLRELRIVVERPRRIGQSAERRLLAARFFQRGQASRFARSTSVNILRTSGGIVIAVMSSFRSSAPGKA